MTVLPKQGIYLIVDTQALIFVGELRLLLIWAQKKQKSCLDFFINFFNNKEKQNNMSLIKKKKPWHITVLFQLLQKTY